MRCMGDTHRDGWMGGGEREGIECHGNSPFADFNQTSRDCIMVPFS
jgi:hypothetical protein